MNPSRRKRPRDFGGSRTGLARALSKLGRCSRREAWTLIESGQVRVNGRVCRNPEQPVNWQQDRFELGEETVQRAAPVYLMLNKPRGLVTTASDEQGRPTVFSCLAGRSLPALHAVGRLDKASEGLLLLTNDTAWSARLTDPGSRLEKIYHVQIDRLPDPGLLEQLRQGVRVDGEHLGVKRAVLLRQGNRNCWLELVLEEGRNRHLRRLLGAFEIETLRLVRVAIGPLQLGELAKGEFRPLLPEEVRRLDELMRPH